MKKVLLLVGLLWICLPAACHAGGESGVTAAPGFLDGGEAWRIINTTCSTVPILISSSAWQNNVGKTAWRSREIINYSTNAALALYPSPIYGTFTSSFGVVLGSVTITSVGSLPNFFAPTWQGQVWGTWDVGCNNGGVGAGGYESYHQEIPASQR